MAESEIRLASSTECIELAELSRVAIEYDLRWRWKPSKIVSLIRSKEHSVIVARNKNTELQGFAAMEFKSTYAHLVLLATKTQFRRQRIASKLLEWLEQSATIAGMDYVSLEVRRGNQAAVRFYEQQGFTVEQVKSGYYEGREDAYKMRHDLIDRSMAEQRP